MAGLDPVVDTDVTPRAYVTNQRTLEARRDLGVIGPGQRYDDRYDDGARVRGVADGGTLLARPDNYIAFRQSGPVPDAETALERALRGVLDRKADA